jgi:2'-5' RNA ligase
VTRRRVFGVVIPVPEELARRADRVRRHYDPNFDRIGPHITVLPPRPLPLIRDQVVRAVRRIAGSSTPLHLSLGPIDTFLPVRPVVYAALSRGAAALGDLHRRLARGRLKGPEAFPYVPHLTLGQELDDGRLRRALRLARRVFSGKKGRVAWQADALVVVERRSETRWIALPPLPIPRPRMTLTPARRRRSRR